MTTKIDISSLDAETKKKIKALGKRSKEIQKGVSDSVCVTLKPIKFKVKAEWNERVSCDLVNFDYDKGYCTGAEKAMNYNNKIIREAHEKFRKKINAEIKDIINFSEKIADKLGVDRTEFFDQYFLY